MLTLLCVESAHQQFLSCRPRLFRKLWKRVSKCCEEGPGCHALSGL